MRQVLRGSTGAVLGQQLGQCRCSMRGSTGTVLGGSIGASESTGPVLGGSTGIVLGEGVGGQHWGAALGHVDCSILQWDPPQHSMLVPHARMGERLDSKSKGRGFDPNRISGEPYQPGPGTTISEIVPEIGTKSQQTDQRAKGCCGRRGG